MDTRIAQLAVAQPRYRVVFVESLQRLGGRFDVPLDQGCAQALGDLEREHRLTGPGLAFDQERSLERDGCIDRDLEVVGCDIGAGSFKAHRASLLPNSAAAALGSPLAGLNRVLAKHLSKGMDCRVKPGQGAQ